MDYVNEKLQMLFRDFDLYKDQSAQKEKYLFRSYVNQKGDACILELPIERFVNDGNAARVAMILDRSHVIAVPLNRISPWYSSNKLRAVLIKKSDFAPNKIKCTEQTYESRNVYDEDEDALSFDYWKAQVRKYPIRPWVNREGWLCVG